MNGVKWWLFKISDVQNILLWSIEIRESQIENILKNISEKNSYIRIDRRLDNRYVSIHQWYFIKSMIDKDW